MTDAEIVRRVLAGETQNYALLVRRYQNMVYGLAYHQVRNFEDARDIAQDVFLQAYLRLAQLRVPDRVGPWLRQIALNECRGFRRGRRPEEPLAAAGQSADDTPRVTDRIFVEQALASLTEPSRLTVILFYFHSYSLAEIAEFLGEPATTIKSRLRNARARLQKEIDAMAEDTFKKEALPDDFAEQVVEFIEAARLGDLAKVDSLLAKDPRLASAANSRNSTALHSAAFAGRPTLCSIS